jgi:signal transduction histidine kinase
MKLSIKKITLIVSALITIVFCYQLYWLYGLYSSTLAKTEKVIKESIPLADHEELFNRMYQLKNIYADSTDFSIDISTNFEGDSIKNKSYYNDEKEIHQADSTYDYFNVLEKNLGNNEVLNTVIHKKIHYAIDTIIAIDLGAIDSLLISKLEYNNIHIDHKLILIKDGSIMNNTTNIDLKEIESNYSKHYNYHYSLDKQYVIRLYIKNPAQQTLIQMIGILSTSIIIFVLLLYIFIYLIKVIRKLQTEEELKTNFTNNMTHELKTPIAVSYAAVDALLISNKAVPLERQVKYLNIAKKQMNHLSGLVEQILSISRKDYKDINIKKEPLNLQNIVNEVIEKQKLVHKKTIEINSNFGIKSIRADKLHLTNVFNNLIENGIKYSGDPVKIDIKTEDKNDHILITVKDNGIGIDTRYQQKLFDKFYRVPTGNKYTIKGYGLGLFYVKEMIKNHNGIIEVQSRLNKGTKFKIKLPK